jgi:hypothetical protein
MKFNRRHLRRLIESVINEQGNPGSQFASSAKKGKQKKSDANKQKATQELQKTYDWFERVVFPAIEDDEWPIKVDDKYYVYAYEKDGIKFPQREGDLVAPVGTAIKSIDQDLGAGQDLAYKYGNLERSVIRCELSVAMQSDQPDEFEAEVKKSKKDRPPVQPELDVSDKHPGKRKEVERERQMNESLSRGSLYRRRYRRY